MEPSLGGAVGTGLERSCAPGEWIDDSGPVDGVELFRARLRGPTAICAGHPDCLVPELRAGDDRCLPRRSSREIRSLIPGAFTVAAADLRNSLLPETVHDSVSGRVYKRPGKWR